MDVIHLWKPDQPGESGEYRVRYKATDRFTKLIINNIAGLPMELKTQESIFNNDKNISDKFNTSIFNIADSLFKANGHIIDYKDKEKKFEKRFKMMVIKDPNKGKFDIVNDPLDLANQFDGYLVQAKAALDNLANAINPLFGTNFSGWKSKKVDGFILSGVYILNELKNKKKKELDTLIKFLEDTMGGISYLVGLRNKPIHLGGNSSLQGFFFDHTKKKRTNPVIRHSVGQTETIREFVDKSFEDTIIFVSKVILYGIQFKAPKGIRIEQFINQRGDTEFCWRL